MLHVKAGTERARHANQWRYPYSGFSQHLPWLVFFNLWPNWGATLYGEVRGATDYKRNLQAWRGRLVQSLVLASFSFIGCKDHWLGLLMQSNGAGGIDAWALCY